MAPVKNNHANIEKAKPPKSAVGFNPKIDRELSFPSYACVVDCGQVWDNFINQLNQIIWADLQKNINCNMYFSNFLKIL